MSRIVVTGLGIITSVGNELASSWEALCHGKSGVGEIDSYDTSQHRVHFGAEVRNFDPALYMDRTEIRPADVPDFDQRHAVPRRTDDPQGASRWLDATRDAFVMGEGAGMLTLEDVEFSKASGAKALDQLVGYAATGDAYHITEPAP